MIKQIILSTIALATVISLNAQQHGSFTDPRDGRIYKTVKIGEQVWMAENLNVDRFMNGDIISHAKTNEEWIQAGNEKKPAWCYYNNDTNNGFTYGKLYNWYAVNDSRGLAPAGWHVSTNSEWYDKLLPSVGEGKLFRTGVALENRAKLNLRSEIGWPDKEKGKNLVGFSALPGGKRDSDGEFSKIFKNAYFWYSDIMDLKGVLGHYLYFCIGNQSILTKADHRYGFSVRCIKD
jgi:uncharacterized protein (TIGR02145 family)